MFQVSKAEKSDQQKGFAVVAILVFILILISIPVGLYLIKNPQILRSRAGANPIMFVDQSGALCDPSSANCTTQTPTFKIQLTSTLGLPASTVTVNTATASAQATPTLVSLDLSKLRSSYNATTGSSSYSPDYDLNHDGIINSFDYVLIIQKLHTTSSSQNGTAFYKISEDPSLLDQATPNPYLSEPTLINYTLKNANPGQKFIWVEFISSNGVIDKRSAAITYAASPQTSSPTQIPTITIALTQTSTSTPAPTTAQSPSISPATDNQPGGLPYLK